MPRGIGPIGSGYVKSQGGIYVPGSDAGAGFTNGLSTLFETANNTWVDLGTPSDLNVDLTANELTISLWFNPQGNLASQNYLFSHSNLTIPSVHFTLGTVNTSLFGYFGNLNSTSGGTIALSTWYHALWTVRNISGTYTGQIYLNGSQVGANTTAGNTTLGTIAVRIGTGSNTNGTSSYPSAAYIDEVTVFNVGFQPSDVTAIYNAGKPTSPSAHPQAGHLTHYWRMGDGDVYPTVTDRAGSVNGTCTNMTSAAHNFVNVHP